MNWGNFIKSLGMFFSAVGSAFLANLKTAYPALQQAAINFLQVITDAVISDIESGAIPIPVLAEKPGLAVDALAAGRAKQVAAFAETTKRLVGVKVPVGVVVTNSLINSSIEISVQKYKATGGGNGGNFIGGNSNGK